MDTTYTFTYSGAWLSLNTIYSTHRWLRNQEKKAWMGKFRQMLVEAEIPALEAFPLHIRYNSRSPCDNLTGGSKILVDTMRGLGIIPDDSKHYYRGVTIEPDLALGHNTYVVTITALPAKRRISTEKAQKSASTQQKTGKPE